MRSIWSGAYIESTFGTAKEVFHSLENSFIAEEKGIDGICKMIADGFVLFPANEGTKASEIKEYIKIGFKVAFLCAGDFKRFKKEYGDFI